ncbi:MAG: (Fe-S)-binding protein [Thermoleophilia bacterium]|nr:(Fe-S)-binding protein [Thermoleophilia bacterium]
MRVLLMRTCLSDAVAPSVWKATKAALTRAGVEVRIPRGQTCCSQPAWNSGAPDQARAVARHTIAVFAGTEPVVVPSGSCAAMVIHSYPDLFKGEPDEEAAIGLASRTIEFTRFLATHNLDPQSRPCGSVTLHDSCHMLRTLDDRDSPREMLAKVPGCEIREMDDTDQCCGFGGMFAVTFPELSGRLGEEKARAAADSGAREVVSCDLGCLMHIAGRAHREGIPIRVRHIAEVLGS